MEGDDLYRYLMDGALRFVAIRLRSKKEVHDYLQTRAKKQESPDAQVQVGKVLERLLEMGYVDDAKFAQWWVTSRRGAKPKGKAIIEQELKFKGVSPATIKEAIQAVESDGTTEIEAAQKAVDRIKYRWDSLPERERRQKAYVWLVGHGFSSEIASKITRSIDQVPEE